MRLREAVPVGYVRSAAFVTRARGCALEDVRLPVYTSTPEARALAALRLELGLGLRDAAIRIGVRAIELSGLEHGKLVPAEASDWARASSRLRGTV